LPISGEKSQIGAMKNSNHFQIKGQNGRNPPFLETGTAHAICCSSGGRAAGTKHRGIEMTATSTFSQRLFAVVAALSMSTFMVVASFSPPSAHAVQAMYA
jgi:hypothetical protein